MSDTRDQNQPEPTPGKTVVLPALRTEFAELADSRWRVGLARYGRPLETHNGRDAGRDAAEEWFDLGVYLQQLRQEHADALADRARLAAEVEGLRAERDAAKAESDLRFKWLGEAVAGECVGILSGFICGEGGAYCSEACRLRARNDVLLREAEVTDLLNSRLSHMLLNAVLFLRDDTPRPMREAIRSALGGYADPGSVVPAVAEHKGDEEIERAAPAQGEHHRPLTMPADRDALVRQAIDSDDGGSVAASNPNHLSENP